MINQALKIPNLYKVDLPPRPKKKEEELPLKNQKIVGASVIQRVQSACQVCEI